MSGGLNISGLSISRNGCIVLTDISLEVRPGECLCLVGASGGGKSLIASSIAGLLPASMKATGRIRLGGEERAADDQRGLRGLWTKQLCLLPQEPGAALAPLLRAADQVALAPPRLGRAEALALLARFGLGHDAAQRLPSELSGGMAQRLLAALVVRTPARVLVVDEPTKGLDPYRRAALIDVLSAMRDDGRALLVVTHDLEVTRALGGQLAVLEAGRIVEMGPGNRLLQSPQSNYLRACIAADPRLWPARTLAAEGASVAAGEDLVIGRSGRALGKPSRIGLNEGQIIGLVGPSGVGKTTLGDTLLGLVPPVCGRVTWFGQTLDRQRCRALRTRFQKLHQDPTAVFPADRSFGQSLTDLTRLPGAGDVTRRLAPLLDRLNISPALLGRQPNQVSGGEAQRLALARVLVLQPALLVADEPCSRLDPPVQAETFRLLRKLADKDGLSILLITHDSAAAEAVCDDIAQPIWYSNNRES